MASGSADVARLRRLLGTPASAWLVERVRARIAQGHTGPLAGSVILRDPTTAQRAAAMRLVGAPPRPGASLRVDLGTLEDVLRRSVWPAGLVDAVTTLTGPIADRPRERAAASAAWSSAADGFAPALTAHPLLEPWWRQWCESGQLRRAAHSDPGAANRLARDAAACLRALPTTGEPLAVFARRIAGDAHALDRTRPLGRLVLAAVAALGTRVPAVDDSIGPRELWAGVGIVISAVSSTVLCLGVPGTAAPDSILARATATALTAWRSAGVPAVLTLDQVLSGGVDALPRDGVVHVCENPSVIEVVANEAARRSTASGGLPDPASRPVLVCTSGQPGAAVLELLDRLVAHGAQVRYHGDFDWAGLRIATTLATHTPWHPWRFGAADYEAALPPRTPVEESRHPGGTTDRHHLSLRGAPATSPWDPALASSMLAHGIAIEEEEVVPLLSADLLTADPLTADPLGADPLGADPVGP